MAQKKQTIKDAVIFILSMIPGGIACRRHFMVSDVVKAAVERGQRAAEERGYDHPMSNPIEHVLYPMMRAGLVKKGGFDKGEREWFLTDAGWEMVRNRKQ